MLTGFAYARPQLEQALHRGVRALGVEEAPDLELQRARNPRNGDYASPVAMKLARALRQPPPQIAARLAEQIGELPEAELEVAGPYLNFRLRTEWLHRLATVAALDERYGSSELGQGERVQVEFGSINPTGPLHVGHGRGVVLGDALSRVLEFTGHRVQREYYVNDQNTQALLFGRSVYARLMGRPLPERGYAGDYVTALAEEARAALPGVVEQPEEEAVPKVQEVAIARMVELLRASLLRLQVEYDEWYFESTLWRDGLAQEAIELLRERGMLAEHDGATWFQPAVAGWESDDEDRVVVRSTGEPTYFASDLGYLLSKYRVRGFQREIEVWGADHHGYVPRMRAAVGALGFDVATFEVILVQLASVTGGRMSKRQGRFITIDELVDAVGSDAARYFYLLRSPDQAMVFDLDLAIREGNENPVYYAQYAHARLANVEQHADARHQTLPATPDLTLLRHPWELDVLREIARWPDVVEVAARLREPHRLPPYVHDLAERVHAFYHAGNTDAEHRMVVDSPELTRARLELARAARNTLRIALSLMGVSAPERM
ncbi:MAG: arginine--tRNA ligase [Candidatus Dormibacteraeota bacterium]|nr:arginine--tRNA ligase [Candidatus Dormibacteraeota bacterium]MBO0744777.1 arginine--tRNA ligase [Candidatus Dormibacteraeota bacterium]